MLCRSIAIQGLTPIQKAIEGAALAEIRIEKSNLNLDEVKTLFASHPNLIATCRPDGIDLKKQKELLSAAVESGAKYVDLEIETDFDYMSSLVTLAKEKACSVIISYHNYNDTPDAAELHKIVKQALSKRADIVKIATQVNDKAANARLLNLYELDAKIIAIGMGPLGKITRVAALYLGAPFTFVSKDEQSNTAPGQLTEFEMESILKYL